MSIKKLAVIYCISFAFQHASAAPVKMESIQTLLALADIENVLKNELQAMQPAIDLQAAALIKQRLGKSQLTTNEELAAIEISEILKSAYAQVLQKPNMIKGIKQVYANNFTEEEIQAYIQFLKTPEGQSIQKKNPQLYAQLIQNAQSNFQNALLGQEGYQLKEKVDQVIQTLSND